MKQLTGISHEFWFFCVLQIDVLILVLTSASSESALFQRLHAFDDYLHKTYVREGPRAVKSKVECAMWCLQDQECGSFFHYLDGQMAMCQTHSVLFLTTNEAVVTPAASYYQLTQDRCPHKDGYILYRPVPLCYRYVMQQLTWSAAKQQCELDQSHLVYVRTPQASAHLVNFLLASSVSRGQHVSVGAQSVNDVWYWLDNSSVTWTDWASGEPSSLKETCLCLAYFYLFKWNDVPCTSYMRYYLCQRDI